MCFMQFVISFLFSSYRRCLSVCLSVCQISIVLIVWPAEAGSAHAAWNTSSVQLTLDGINNPQTFSCTYLKTPCYILSKIS